MISTKDMPRILREFPARSTIGTELKSGALVEVSIVEYKD
jgi:hypothetical protein